LIERSSDRVDDIWLWQSDVQIQAVLRRQLLLGWLFSLLFRQCYRQCWTLHLWSSHRQQNLPSW